MLQVWWQFQVPLCDGVEDALFVLRSECLPGLNGCIQSNPNNLQAEGLLSFCLGFVASSRIRKLNCFLRFYQALRYQCWLQAITCSHINDSIILALTQAHAQLIATPGTLER